MKTLHRLSMIFPALAAAPAMAHVGPEAIQQHVVEHLLITLAVIVPIAYGLRRIMRKH